MGLAEGVVEDRPHMAEITFRVDAYGGHEWRARVTSFSPATGAEFSLLPPQNATGNWVKVVQRVPVRLRIEQRPDAPDAPTLIRWRTSSPVLPGPGRTTNLRCGLPASAGPGFSP